MSHHRTFKPLNMFKAKLVTDMPATAYLLPLEIPQSIRLHETLGKDHYTYLTISNGCDDECVQVHSEYGQLVMDRASDCRSWPCGTCVEFHITEQGLIDMINQAVPEPPEPEHTPAGYNGKLCVGRWTYHFENGWLSHRSCNNAHIPQGIVEAPALCFDEDGCLTQVTDSEKLPTFIYYDK